MTAVPDTATTVVRASHVLGARQGHWTYAAYAALPEPEGFRYEVIDGVLFMSPAPIPAHERLVISIGARLSQLIEDTTLGQVFASPDIDLGLQTLRPDAVVVLNANLGIVAPNRLIGPPDLVVEIASLSTASYDRTEKLAAYAAAGVPEYLIVEPAARSIEVFALDGAVYRSCGVAQGADPLPAQRIAALAVPVSGFFPRG